MPENNKLTTQQMISIIRNGLKKSQIPKNITIVGAGLAGHEDRIQYALKNLAEIYGDQVYSEFVTGTSYSWVDNPYAAGALAAFEPGQENELFPYIPILEGRVHFAGEHTTLTHGWMQGAIESGIQVAYQVNHLPK